MSSKFAKFITKYSQSANGPTDFDPMSFYNINLGFGSENISNIKNLAKIINNSLYYNSGGKYDLSKLRQVDFNLNDSTINNQQFKLTLQLAKLVYWMVFTNNGKPFESKLPPDEIADRINKIKNSNCVVAMPDATSTQLANSIGGLLKPSLTNVFNLIK